MNEIIISDPPENMHDRRSRYSYEESTMKIIGKELDYRGITPISHPLTVDIFSGDGAIALLLNQKGWDAANITCIDSTRSTRPLIEGVH